MRLAAIDIGTNSVHMIVVRVRPDLSFEVIDREKAMVRLGAGGLDGKELTTEAMGAAIVPANAARATPNAKTNANSNRMLTPSEAAISRLLAPARIIMPMRVRWMTKYIARAMTMQTTVTNRR